MVWKRKFGQQGRSHLSPGLQSPQRKEWKWMEMNKLSRSSATGSSHLPRGTIVGDGSAFPHVADEQALHRSIWHPPPTRRRLRSLEFLAGQCAARHLPAAEREGYRGLLPCPVPVPDPKSRIDNHHDCQSKSSHHFSAPLQFCATLAWMYPVRYLAKINTGSMASSLVQYATVVEAELRCSGCRLELSHGGREGTLNLVCCRLSIIRYLIHT